MAETGALVGGTLARGVLCAGPCERTERSRLFREDRFLPRARALFYARLAFLVLGLGVIGVPSWSAAFGVGGPKAYAVYLVMVAYSAANYVFLPKKSIGRQLTFATLCADLCVLVWLVSMTGGLRSPLLAAQLLFTTLFVVLFPTPLAVVPPLLTFPVVAKLDQLLGGHAVVQIDIFILLWYSAINCILVYVMVYLNERDRMKHRELQKLSAAVRFSRMGRERSVGPESSLALFRVLQESIANVAKHCGKGTAVDVTLTFAEGKAALRIQDHGKGFALAEGSLTAREGHYGLANM